MKTIIATIAVLAAAVGFGDTERQANQSWVLHKIDEIVGTNTAAQLASLSSSVSSLSSDVSGLESSKRDKTDNIFADGISDLPMGTWQGYMIGPNILKLGMEMGDPIVCIDTTSYYAQGYWGLMTIGSDWPYVSGRLEVKSGEGGSASIVVNGTNVMDYISSKVGPSEVASIVTNDVIASVSDEWMKDGQPLNTDVWEMFWDGSVWVLVGEHESANYPIQGGHSRNDTRIVYQQGVLTRSATYKNALGLAYERDFDRRISAADPAFSNAVMAVGLNIDTNSVAVLNEIAATFGGFPVTGTATTVGGLLAALAAAVAWLRKRAAHLDSDGLSDETFATDLLGKQVAIQKIDERLPIPISTKSAGFTTESYKRFVVTVSGAMTVTLHKPTGTDAEVFECRFDGSGLSADASITFAKVAAFGSADAITTMDTDCGTVTAGKVALMSAFWNGTTWDVNWKVGG